MRNLVARWLYGGGLLLVMVCFPAQPGHAFLSSSSPRIGATPLPLETSPVVGLSASLSREENDSGQQRQLLGQDPDRQRRRQLVLSLLTAVATTPLAQPATAAVTGLPGSLVVAAATLAAAAAIVKPPLDDRDYRSLTLASNGLRVLLVSDPTTLEAAVAMDVHVGATSDPATVPGLAHFNEHMLFLGTKAVGG